MDTSGYLDFSFASISFTSPSVISLLLEPAYQTCMRHMNLFHVLRRKSRKGFLV